MIRIPFPAPAQVRAIANHGGSILQLEPLGSEVHEIDLSDDKLLPEVIDVLPMKY